MSMGYALTEQYEIKDGYPVSRSGTLGLFKADKVPEQLESEKVLLFQQHRGLQEHIIS